MKYTEYFEVGSHDVDINDNVRPSVLIRYLQECGNHQMRDRKPSMIDLIMNNQTFIVTRMTVEIYEQLHQYDKIEVSTWNCPGKLAVFRRCYEIVRDGKVVLSAYGEFAAAEFVNRKIISTADLDISNYEVGELSEFNIPLKFRFPKALEFKKLLNKRVTYDQVDMNCHLNNTCYPDIFWSEIPEIQDMEVTSFNMRFMHEAAMGDELEILIAEPEAEWTKDPNAESACAFISKVNGEKNYEVVFGLRKTKKPEWSSVLEARIEQ